MIAIKIKRYKLKDGTTEEELIAFGAKEGGSYKYYLNKFIRVNYPKGRFGFDFSINIGFNEDISDWNDYDNVLVMDEDFCQPYTAFYGDNYGKEIKNFYVIEECIRQYNEYMDSIPFLIQIKG